jgi:acetylornithine deacetylase/succinyl-diaminopimelate desuccinylase-like protein
MREEAIANAVARLDDGRFLSDLSRYVSVRSESQNPPRPDDLSAYLSDEIGPDLARLGFRIEIFDNPLEGRPPILLAERLEGDDRATLLAYGHGDVVPGYDDAWREGEGPWRLAVDGERVYGRGTADNKGQHAVLLQAVAAVIETRGRLGFNLKILMEMGEETGSPGLREFCRAERQRLAADLFIASDGPRVAADKPTLFLGSRGLVNLDLRLKLRDSGHHSGNWGGALANPATILVNAIATIVDGRGRVLLPALLPSPIPANVRAALLDCPVGGDPGDPEVDADWGEPGLSPSERVFAWNTFEILAMTAGNPAQPANAVPPEAVARCQIRFVVGSDWENFLPAIRRHLDAQGFGAIEVSNVRDQVMAPTRLDPDHPRVRWAAGSIARTLGRRPVILPNLGGGLPNDIFANDLGLPTIWIPHSYPGCQQHGPDEHTTLPILREGLAMMAGLLWDLGEERAAERT